MGFEDVTRGQGSFVSRTKSIDKPNSFTAEYEVAASTTYEPTGSFQNSAFIVEAGTAYNLSQAYKLQAPGASGFTGDINLGNAPNIA